MPKNIQFPCGDNYVGLSPDADTVAAILPFVESHPKQGKEWTAIHWKWVKRWLMGNGHPDAATMTMLDIRLAFDSSTVSVARNSVTHSGSIIKYGGAPTKGFAFEISSDPGAMAWRDGTNTYRFNGQKVLWELWTVLVSDRKRFTIDQLKQSVKTWSGLSATDDNTIKDQIKNLRKFWRQKNRPDLANKITTDGGAVGYDIPTDG